MTDATTADDFPLGLLVDEALREAQQGLQNSDEEELNKLAETIDPDDLETEPATTPVVRAAQVVATPVVATAASQYVIPQFAVAGVAVPSPTKRQKTQVPNGWVSKQVAHLWQLKIVRRAFRPTHARTADATCQCSQTALHEEVAWYKALAKAHDLPMYPHSQ